MPAKRLKALYKGKCRDDLQTYFNIPSDVEPERLWKTAPKLFKAAEEARLVGDEELSFIYFMKFLNIACKLQHCKEKIRNLRVKDALDYCEELSASLDRRYEELEKQEAELLNKIKNIQIEEKVSSKPLELHPPEDINRFSDVSDGFTSCSKLYSLLNEKKRILIMDVRSAPSYDDSHMKADYIISIPESIVMAGMTAAKLEKVLPLSSKDLWRQRGNVDLVVLVDSSTSSKNFKHESPLSILRDILLKWDSDIQYEHKPLILDGGYEEWVLRYPVCTTNPAPRSLLKDDNIHLSDFLGEIEYPDLSETSEFSQPSIDRSSKPSLSDFHAPQSTPKLISTSSASNSIPSSPVFSKSGVPNAPKVLSSNTSINAPMKAVLPHHDNTTDLRPNVDRTSKAAALLIYRERSQNVQALLHREEEVVTSTLALEENKQKIEEEREKIRMRREMEAEEEMRVQLLEREDQLLKDIQNLEMLQKEKDKENQALRAELAEYKKRDQEDKLPREYSVYRQEEDAIAARIRDTEEKRKKIVQDREKKILEEYQSQKKKLKSDGCRTEYTYEERANQAQAKLQEHLDKDKHKQEKFNDVKERVHQGPDVNRSTRSSFPNKSVIEVHRDKKPHETAKEQPSTCNDKVNGTHIVPLKDISSGMMKRSRSSPNIAQLNDDLNDRGKIYKSNFALDTRPSRHRNFSPVYGAMGRGLTGLKNLGNTCYMNSIIQCLSNTTPLAKFFVSGQYRNHINRHNDTRGEVVEEVAAVVRALWSSEYKCIATRDLRSVVGKYRDQFQTNQQQDSNEFLTILMDWLHEDLKKPMVNSIGDVQKEQHDWEKQWNAFYKENSSLIVLLFYGQQKSTVKCSKCFKESVRYETFSNLTLPLPSNTNSCTLEDCVQLYVQGEHITGWKCPACKEQRDAMKKFDIIKLPPILIIHFKRFYIDGWCRKRQTFVQFPLADWDMRKHTLLPDQLYTKYNLYGVSNHYGTMEGGHYTAYCKSVEHKKWYKFDDNEVSEISPADVQTGAAYILFYASINLRVPDVS